MSWKPLHDLHAIERFRVLIHFTTPLADKIIAKAVSEIEGRHTEFGFEDFAREPSAVGAFPVQILNIPVLAAPMQAMQKPNGWSFRRLHDGAEAEAVAFRDMRFGYVTAEYQRWADVSARFWQLMEFPLQTALEAGEIQNIRLEYWDRFTFDGNPMEARIDALLANVDSLFPTAAVDGGSLWHSHRGWFDDAPANNFLVNLNIDANDIVDSNGEPRRSVGFYNFVEYRPNGIDLNVQAAKSVLQQLHEISKSVFGKSVIPSVRSAVGLALKDSLNG